MVIFAICSLFFVVVCCLTPIPKDEEMGLSLSITTAMKGFCAISIVLGHLGLLTFAHLSATVVALFFLLSGYGLMFSLENKSRYLDDFLHKRLVKLLIPYLFFIVLHQILTRCLFQATSISDAISNFVHDGNLNGILPYSWFVMEIILLYIFFYLSFKWITNLNVAIILLSACVICVMAFFAWLYVEGWGGIWWFVSTPAFVIGIILKRKEDTIFSCLRKKQMIYKIGLIAIAVFFFLVNQITYKPMMMIAPTFLSTILAIALYRWHIHSVVLNHIGKVSYEIYLSQAITIPLCYTYLPYLSKGCFPAFCAVVILLTILLAVCTHSLLEKINSKIL